MSERKIVAAHFSPTGTTRKTVLAVADGMGAADREIDLCKEVCEMELDESAVILAAVPVYAGRVPAIAAERLGRIQGNGQKAVAIAVYGNREFDDALLELKNILENNGFQVVAAGAFIAEHSIVRSIAHGRPDEQDMKIAEQFGADVLKKMESGEAGALLAIPGNDPYIEVKPSAFHPAASDACVMCGQCADMCPAAAIPAETPNQTISDKCINCMRCVQVCPVQARALPEMFLAGAKKMLEEKAAGYKKPQLFL